MSKFRYFRMSGGEIKRSRVWNPALDDEDDGKGQQERTGKKPFMPPPVFPFFIQNYLPLLMRFQQQRMQEMNSAVPVMPPPVASLPPAPRPPPAQNGCNPLVAQVLGVCGGSTENSCATCGASFRLTSDLVQHMRNNHRVSRFKRKNEKPLEPL